MTVWDLLAIAVQRWAVTLAGVLFTTLAVFATTTVPPVYLAQAQVVLLPPTGAQPNGYTNTRESLVTLAGVLLSTVKGIDDASQPVSDGVTILGEGRTDGASVRQQNVGGQWEYRFDKPVLDVQAVGAAAPSVEARLSQTVGQLESALTQIQDSRSVAAVDRIRIAVNPITPQASAQTGSVIRAMLAAGVAGLLATIMALAFLGRKTVPSAARLATVANDTPDPALEQVRARV